MTDTPNDWTDKDLEQLSRIAPHAVAPSERAGKVREIVIQNISGCIYCSGQPKLLIDAIESLLDAECKAAVARRDEEWELAKQIIYADAERQVKAAEERAFKEREELRSTHLVHQFDEAFKTTREHAREICKLLGLADSENWLYVRHEVPKLLDTIRKAAVASSEAKLERRNKQLLVADNALRECEEREKAAVAAALAEASALVISMSANHYGSWGSSPGINSDIVDAIRALSPSPNYIALREADARIDEYRANEAAYSASTNFEKWRMWKEQHIATLTEARDRIAKETK